MAAAENELRNDFNRKVRPSPVAERRHSHTLR